MNKIIFRADGNKVIGFGHVYRLIALSEILRNHFECVFVISDTENVIIEQIERSCSSCVILNKHHDYKLPGKSNIDDEIQYDLDDYVRGGEIVVTDGYLFGPKYQLAVKNSGSKLICIDDKAELSFYADIVINHAPGIDKNIYDIAPYTRLFLGLDYAILRSSFYEPIRIVDNAAVAFVSLGGSDYFGYTNKIADMLLKLDVFERLNILCASAFDKGLVEELKSFSQNSDKVRLHFNLDAKAIVQVMSESTHAFVSASSVLIESYSRGLKCFTGYYTSNQTSLYNGFINEKLAIGLDDFNYLESNIISESIKRQGEINRLSNSLTSAQKILGIFKTVLKDGC